jgi:hypothetical protein
MGSSPRKGHRRGLQYKEAEEEEEELKYEEAEAEEEEEELKCEDAADAEEELKYEEEEEEEELVVVANWSSITRIDRRRSRGERRGVHKGQVQSREDKELERGVERCAEGGGGKPGRKRNSASTVPAGPLYRTKRRYREAVSSTRRSTRRPRKGTPASWPTLRSGLGGGGIPAPPLPSPPQPPLWFRADCTCLAALTPCMAKCLAWRYRKPPKFDQEAKLGQKAEQKG